MGGEVKVHGAWPSPFSCRIVWALKLKGIPYEYIEEDTFNKSDLLLKHNPVHKKIPVLVHGGKPVCESMVILEYIEETWPQNSLLPNNPFDRAMARFWIKFADDKANIIWLVYRTTGEEQEKAIKASVEMLKTIEDHAFPEIGFVGEKKYFGGEKIGMVDIAFGGIGHWMRVIEEIVGVKIMEERSFPRLQAWIKNFKMAPVIKDNLPDSYEMFKYFVPRREMLLGIPSIPMNIINI